MLRDVLIADREIIRRWRNQPEIAAQMYSDHLIGQEEHARWFAAAMHDPHRRQWIIAHRGDDVGFACLTELDAAAGTAAWAFYLAAPRLRGSGVGALAEFAVVERAFGPFALRRLSCEVLVDNQAVLHGHEAFGFTRTGVLSARAVKRGAAVDAVALELAREEWQRRRPAMAGRIERIERRLGVPGIVTGDESRLAAVS